VHMNLRLTSRFCCKQCPLVWVGVVLHLPRVDDIG
jgi:hypothetical protein